MMKKIVSIFLIFAICEVFISTSTCSVAFAKKQKEQYSQLQIREMQTRYYDTTDTKAVKAGLVSALQDGGFVISEYEDELGLITARNEYMAKRTNKTVVAIYSTALIYYAVLAGFTFGSGAIYMVYPALAIKNEIREKDIIIDSNVVISQEGNRTKVRVNFVEKVYNFADGLSYKKSNIRNVIRVESPFIYQEFYKEVDKSIFLEKNNL